MSTPRALALTAADVAAAVDGRLISGAGGAPIGGFSIDTRTLRPGDLYFAIRGTRLDGHAFVPAALAGRAAGVVVSDLSAVPARVAGDEPIVLVVDDTVRALQALARHVRRLSGARLIAITGSTGKTTTKEIAADFLAARYRVFRNRGNLNNHIGLPLSLLELRTKPDVAVVELGMNHPGEIRVLVGIAEPDVRVWTNVGDAHLGFFESVDGIAEAKAEILDGASGRSLLVVNGDDPRIMARVRAFPGRVVTFGIESAADVEARDVRELGVQGLAARIRTWSGEAAFRAPLLGRGNLANVLAATAVALHEGVPLAAIASRAATLRPAPRRGEIAMLRGGITLIDDSYNSSPAALRRMLESVGQIEWPGRRVAVLGEMLELGDQSLALHQACGRDAAAAGITRLLTVGGLPARALGAAAAEAGLDPERITHAGSAADAADLAASVVRSGDLILIKGSRGIGLEAVADRLKAELG